MRKSFAPILFLTLLLAPLAQAQTRPSDTAWLDTFQTFTQALSTGDQATVSDLIASDLTLKTFDGKSKALSQMLDLLNHATIISAHAYVGPPIAMAADLAADFKIAKYLPDTVRNNMQPADDAAMQQANATAIQWLQSTVGAADNDDLAIIALWPAPSDTPAPDPKTAPVPTPIFLIIKAEQTPQGPRIQTLIYGDPV